MFLFKMGSFSKGSRKGLVRVFHSRVVGGGGSDSETSLSAMFLGVKGVTYLMG